MVYESKWSVVNGAFIWSNLTKTSIEIVFIFKKDAF